MANTYAILNTEYHLVFMNNLFVHRITDLGYFENDLSNLIKSYSAMGLNALTKVGLFKLNYATAKIENEPFQVSNSKVHISLASQF